MERPRGMNCIKTGGGSALCTLHRGEGHNSRAVTNVRYFLPLINITNQQKNSNKPF